MASNLSATSMEGALWEPFPDPLLGGRVELEKAEAMFDRVECHALKAVETAALGSRWAFGREASVEEVPQEDLPNDAPHQIPAPSANFHGRRMEFIQLSEGLRSRRNLLLTGEAGVGKTSLTSFTLSRLFGTEVRSPLATEIFPGGIVFIHMPTFGMMTKEVVWAHIADSFQVADHSHLSPRYRAQMALRRNLHHLVVLDGCEAAGSYGGGWGWEEILEITDHSYTCILANGRTSAPSDRWKKVELTELGESEAQTRGDIFDDYIGEKFIPLWARSALLHRLRHPMALCVAGELLESAEEDMDSTLSALLSRLGVDESPGKAEPSDDGVTDLFRRGAKSLYHQAEDVLTKFIHYAGHGRNSGMSDFPDLHPLEAAWGALEETRVLRNKVAQLGAILVPEMEPLQASREINYQSAAQLSMLAESSVEKNQFFAEAAFLLRSGKKESALDLLYDEVHRLAGAGEYFVISEVMDETEPLVDLLSLQVGLLSSSHPFRSEVAGWHSLYQRLEKYLTGMNLDPKRILPAPLYLNKTRDTVSSCCFNG